MAPTAFMEVEKDDTDHGHETQDSQAILDALKAEFMVATSSVSIAA